MFGQRLALFELLRLRGDPLLHLLQQGLVFPTADAPRLLVARALRLPRARATGAERGAVVANRPTQFDTAGSITQCLAGGAAVAVLLGVVDEAFFAVQALLGVGAGHRFGNVGCDAGFRTF